MSKTGYYGTVWTHHYPGETTITVNQPGKGHDTNACIVLTKRQAKKLIKELYNFIGVTHPDDMI